MNKNKAFVKNTIILFIGKFATQFMSLLLLPLYTHYLLTDDYGTVDLLQTYISLFIPVLTLRIDSAIFRFLIDKRKNDEEIKKVLSNIFLILGFGILFTLIAALILNFFFRVAYFKSVVLNTIVMMISSIMLQILRGLGKNIEYSIVSVVTGAVTLISNAILIMILNFNANSILISSSIANMVCILYVAINISLWKYISLKKIDKVVLKETLDYSLPMIPNALSWWIVNVSDRTIISMFLGVAVNGIYTVSCKFSNILNSIFSIVSMSWQESATLHINDDDRDEYFSNMINSIFMIFSTISLLIVSILPFIYSIIIGDNYMTSYIYIPILLYANSWNVLIGLIGGIYIAKKRTKEIASTTILSAILNIVINLL
ncbi:TPA: lipopolysaccharide biosynthesis protein, partial [Streptococcus suis]